MKTDGNAPIGVIDGMYGADSMAGGHTGLTKRELMSIEFTKTLLGLRHYDNQPVYELNKVIYDPNNEFSHFNSQKEADKQRNDEVDSLTEKALFVADALIKALNKGGQNG